MADIFVSYSRQDKARAAQFVELLEGFGWDVFWDQETRAGTIWPKVLEDELGLARCLLVLWTANSVASRWVRIEAYEALQGDKLLPVRLENVKPPMEFRQTQTFDLLGWSGDLQDPRLDHLIADLCALAKLEPRKGTLGPATLIAVRTLVPSTLGVSTWQTPSTLMGGPDFSGHHAPNYRSVGTVGTTGTVVPTLTAHAQEPVQLESSGRADTLPFADPLIPKSDARRSDAARSDATQEAEPLVEPTGAELVGGVSTIERDRFRRNLSWGAGLAVVVVGAMWIATSEIGPTKVIVKEPFVPERSAAVPDPAPPTAAIASPAPVPVPVAPPALNKKPTVATAKPPTPSNRCIEITERYQQTGQWTAEEQKFLSSKECAR